MASSENSTIEARCARAASSRFRSATTAAIMMLITAIVPRKACSSSKASFGGPSAKGPRPWIVPQIARPDRIAIAAAVSRRPKRNAVQTRGGRQRNVSGCPTTPKNTSAPTATTVANRPIPSSRRARLRESSPRALHSTTAGPTHELEDVPRPAEDVAAVREQAHQLGAQPTFARVADRDPEGRRDRARGRDVDEKGTDEDGRTDPRAKHQEGCERDPGRWPHRRYARVDDGQAEAELARGEVCQGQQAQLPEREPFSRFGHRPTRSDCCCRAPAAPPFNRFRRDQLNTRRPTPADSCRLTRAASPEIPSRRGGRHRERLARDLPRDRLPLGGRPQ